MKIGKIIWGGFAFVGIVTSLILISIVIFYFILIRTPENNEKDNRCLTDQNTILETQLIGDYYYSVILHTSGIADKIQQLLLYKDERPPSDYCIEKKKIIDYSDLYYGRENEPDKQWPKEIIVKNDSVIIGYTSDRDKSINVFNIDIKWIVK